MIQLQCRNVEQAKESSSGSPEDIMLDGENETNKISEDTLKSLISIFIRLSTSKGKTMDSESFSPLVPEAFSENDAESDFQDPYSLTSKFKDVGPYKYFYSIEAGSIDLSHKANASFLIRRLKWVIKLFSARLEFYNAQDFNFFDFLTIVQSSVANIPSVLIFLVVDSKLFTFSLRTIQDPARKVGLCKVRESNPPAEACILDKYLQFLHDECKTALELQELKVLHVLNFFSLEHFL